MTNQSQSRFFTGTLILLSAISFFTDIASEMLFPIMPLYLAQIGYSPLQMGILESASELTLGFCKGYFGYLSDRFGRHRLMIRLGYGISAIAKPLIGITQLPALIFGARLGDRLAKGIRSAPRDGLLSRDSQISTRGKIFGFHRSMDTLGATLGPIITIILLGTVLSNHSNPYQTIFLLALIPGVIATSLTFWLKKPRNPELQTTGEIALNRSSNQLKGIFTFWKASPSNYKFLVFGLFLTALINSSDIFVILRLQEYGLSSIWILGSYVAYNLAAALLAYPVGLLCDRIGFQPVYIFGLSAVALVSFGFSQVLDLPMSLLTMIGYGVFPVINEVVAKAWISTHLTPELQGTGLGLGLFSQSCGAVLASIFIGIIWQFFGSGTAFNIISLASIGLIGYFWFMTTNTVRKSQEDIVIGCNPRH